MSAVGHWWWPLVAALAFACRGGGGEPQTGSESHFLEQCDSMCPDGLECVCGVCTERCSENPSCTPWHESAECVAVASRPAASTCTDEGVEAFCDVRCETTIDCAGLGADFTCQSGFCRQDAPTRFQSGRIELEQLCDFYAEAACRAKIECYDWNYRDQAHCLEATECQGWDLLNRELAAGTVTFDPVATYDCYQRIVADPCALGLFFEVPTLSQALARCDALTGLQPLGAACEVGVECAGEATTCDLTASCPGVCAAQEPSIPLGSLGLGEACNTVLCVDLDDDPSNDVERCEQCAVGLVCYQGTCRADWQLGEACTTIAACRPNLWCDLALGVCAPLAQLNEPCNPIGHEAPGCEPPLLCYTDNLSTGTCLEKTGAGGPCVDEYDCPEPLRCLPTSAGASVGTCGGPVPSGSPCDANEDCQTDFCTSDGVCAEGAPGLGCTDTCLNCMTTCGDGLTCREGACANNRYPGEPCGDADICLQSTCQAGTCVLARRIGEACSANVDCLSGYCNDGACADPAGCQ